MRRAVGVAMMVDGVLHALGIAELLPTFLDRSLRDQILVVARAIAGAGLVFLGRQNAGSESWSAGATASVYALLGALAIALVETAWFNWPATAARALYTAAALYVVTRNTTLPTT